MEPNLHRRSPSWGAWIEIPLSFAFFGLPPVAPPRGERGLKLDIRPYRAFGYGRSPSWGAWIEIALVSLAIAYLPSLPLVGSVD